GDRHRADRPGAPGAGRGHGDPARLGARWRRKAHDRSRQGRDHAAARRRQGQTGLVIAIDVARFRPLADFMGDVGSLARAIKALPRLPEVEEILLPGERGARQADARRRSGIPLAGKTWDALAEIAGALGLAMPALQTA